MYWSRFANFFVSKIEVYIMRAHVLLNSLKEFKKGKT